MTGNLNMNNNHVVGLPSPTQDHQPVTRAYGHSNYLSIDGKTAMIEDLNMGKKIHRPSITNR